MSHYSIEHSSYFGAFYAHPTISFLLTYFTMMMHLKITTDWARKLFKLHKAFLEIQKRNESSEVSRFFISNQPHVLLRVKFQHLYRLQHKKRHFIFLHFLFNCNIQGTISFCIFLSSSLFLRILI